MDKLARHLIGYSSAMEGKPRGIVLSEVSQSQEAAECVMPSVEHCSSEREQISGCWGGMGSVTRESVEELSGSWPGL